MTTGLPGYPSTWWFYRYTLLSDLFLHTAVLGLHGRSSSRLRPRRTRAAARALARP